MFRLIQRSLIYHWRIHLAVALGVAAAVAVLTGALVVGDSVRGSLRALTLERLGHVDQVLVRDQFFRTELADALKSEVGTATDARHVEPVILISQGTVERQAEGVTRRASNVLVLGCGPEFWALDTSGLKPPQMPADREIVLNEPLADELGVKVGDTVTLRLPSADQVPGDSPLAERDDRTRGLPRLLVVDIVPAEGLGQFSLQASQARPANAFVSLATIQQALDQPDRVNAILVGQPGTGQEPDAVELAARLKPTLADWGINLDRVTHTYQPAGGTEQVAIDYYTVTTDRMIFAPEMSEAIAEVLGPRAQPVLTYLANGIQARKPAREGESPLVPYSMVTAIELSDDFPLVDRDGKRIGPLAHDEIVLNEWTADDLRVEPGARIRVSYFEPETTHGEAVERTARFQLKAIAKLTKPVRPYRLQEPAVYDAPLTLANDPALTPEVEGVTDQETIENWDPPFPFFYDRVRKPVDEDYWDAYRTTPKAFVALETGQRLWGSRFGKVTSFRVTTDEVLASLADRLEAGLAKSAVELGFQFLPIKQQQLAASQGTTRFDVLFLLLSLFVIAAALMMVALLFRLGIEQRSSEIGTLLALGYRRGQVMKLLGLEGTLVAAGGAGLGVFVGLGYAWLMLAALRSWWVGAITTPFLKFHATGLSIAIGYSLGLVITALTIFWSIRRTRGLSVRRLLAGQATEAEFPRRRYRPLRLTAAFLVTALVLSVFAVRLGGLMQAVAFVGAGASLLTALLFWIRRRIRFWGTTAPDSLAQGMVLWRMAARNAGRNPGRSVITIGLMATATFLILAMSSFRLAPDERGVGGFEWVAESSQPVYVDLNTPANRDEWFGSRASDLAEATIFGLRLRSGDDASCNNLYQALQPRVIGVTKSFVQYFERPENVSFSWSAADAKTADERDNPWQLLDHSAVNLTEAVPVVLDKNTALYSLHLYRGIGEEFAFEYDGQTIRFRVVGLLENSLLQGNLLIGEADFKRRFPELSGYRYFLISVPPARAEVAMGLLEDRLSDQGLDARPSHEVLQQLLAVQNTYLTTFQSLGALGLLLGTFGLATVQLRNVLERRSELALLRATGYRRQRLANMVLLESIVLLATGLGTGAAAALLAVLPHKLLGESAVSWDLLRDLVIMLAVVLVTGLGASLISVRAVLRLPLLASLRAE